MFTIDYSQYKAWMKCPMYWTHRYLDGYRKKFTGQRKDAMAIGSLVHDGLMRWARDGRPEIGEAVVAEINPTPETLVMAQEMVLNYVRLYPNEDWEIHRLEEPLEFKVDKEETLRGLAKIDAYFYIPERTEVESGVEGYQISLSPGWWIREYKTKDAGIDRAKWNTAWECNMQADFQMLALQEKIGEPVQGVLVNVLEKPKVYVPKRKCQGCGEMWEMAAYLIASDGKHACPMCGHVQTLKPYEAKTKVTPQYYRVVVVRSPERLESARKEIENIGSRMQMAKMEREAGMRPDDVPNREACVHTIFGLCEFFDNDTYGLELEGDDTLEKYEPLSYLGEVK